MNEENKFWLALWLGLGALICALAMVVGATVYKINLAAFEHGYEARMLPGADMAHWVKVGE